MKLRYGPQFRPTPKWDNRVIQKEKENLLKHIRTIDRLNNGLTTILLYKNENFILLASCVQRLKFIYISNKIKVFTVNKEY